MFDWNWLKNTYPSIQIRQWLQKFTNIFSRKKFKFLRSYLIRFIVWNNCKIQNDSSAGCKVSLFDERGKVKVVMYGNDVIWKTNVFDKHLLFGQKREIAAIFLVVIKAWVKDAVPLPKVFFRHGFDCHSANVIICAGGHRFQTSDGYIWFSILINLISLSRFCEKSCSIWTVKETAIFFDLISGRKTTPELNLVPDIRWPGSFNQKQVGFKWNLELW